MKKVISLRLSEDQVKRLQRAGHRLGRKVSEVAVILLEEALRQRDFPFIEFRDTVVGRQAHLKGTRLKVWQIVNLARDFDGDGEAVAAHLEMPAWHVASALAYAAAYPAEIEAASGRRSLECRALDRNTPMGPST